MSNHSKNSISERFAGMNRDKLTALMICVLMIIISFIISFLVIKDIFTFELKHAYTADAPLYWSVGRGILNGLTPYADMYENKPPGIFLISALSFALTNDTIICNLFSCLAALMLTILPAVFLLNKYKHTEIAYTEGTGAVRKTTAFLIILMSCLLVTVYAEVRSGGFQVEAIGAAFSVLFICLSLKLKTAKTKKQTILLTVFAALAIGCAVMIKEPFLLVSVFGALLFVDNFKGFLKQILLPCVAGGIITLLALAIGGVLSPYFSIYIKRMFETRLSGQSSAFSRAFNIIRVVKDTLSANGFVFGAIILFFVLTLLRPILNKRGIGYIIFHVIRVAAAVFIASFCVGMGGQYYNHHYVFAVPVYISFILYGGSLLFEFKPQKFAVHGATLLLWGVALLAVFLNMGNQYSGDYTGRFNAISAKAQYVDNLLNFYGEDRYQFIGFNGENVFFGLTHHSPQGPVFGQDSDNFQTDDTWFAKSLKDQLDKSNIIIVKEFTSPALNNYIQNLLATEFTQTPKTNSPFTPPAGFEFQIYYRASVFG